MTTPLTPEALEKLARKRAGAKLGWYAHASVFVLVKSLLIVEPEQLSPNEVGLNSVPTTV